MDSYITRKLLHPKNHRCCNTCRGLHRCIFPAKISMANFSQLLKKRRVGFMQCLCDCATAPMGHMKTV